MQRIVCFHSDVDFGVATHLALQALKERVRAVDLLAHDRHRLNVDTDGHTGRRRGFGVWLGSKLRVSSRGGSRWKWVGVMEELNNNSVCL